MDTKLECYFQYYMEDYLNGKPMNLGNGRTDITNIKIHAELKIWTGWKNGIGQLRAYRRAEYRDEMHLYLFGKSPKNKDEHIRTIIDEDIKPFEMIIKPYGFDIIDLNNKQKVHSIYNKDYKLKEEIEALKQIINQIQNVEIEEAYIDDLEEKNIHSCPRCGYETDRISNFKSHLERIHICKPKIANVSLDKLKEKYKKVRVLYRKCEQCDSNFFSKSKYFQHKKECEKTIHMNMIKKDIQLLRTSYKIKITALGKEDKSKIIINYDFMIGCMNKEMDGMCYYLIQKHFSENHNVKKTNKKDKFIETHNGKEWEVRLINKALDEILSNVEKDFKYFINKNPTIDKNILDKFMRNVGAPLNWSLDHDDYKFDDDMNIKTKDAIKKDIYLFVCEQIYRKSKEQNI